MTSSRALAGALPYLVLLLTGLRRTEFEALEWGDVILDTPRPFFRVRASTTKNHKSATIFLHPDLIGLLQQHRRDSHGDEERVFKCCPSVEELKADLAAAEIPFIDEQGRRFDVHSFRHTLATILANSGVPRRVAMDMMRHNDSRLTDKTYTDSNQLMTADAIELLPSMVVTHTQNHTQKFVAGRLAVSSPEQVGVGCEVQETPINKGESLALANFAPLCPNVGVGSPGRARTYNLVINSHSLHH